MPALEFRLPDVGEGIDAAEILAWRVAVGDAVVEDQPLADVQTDKAIVELPCPTTGTVVRLAGEVGDTVAVGEVLAVFEPAEDAAASAIAAPDEAPRATVPTDAPAASPPAARSMGAAARPLASPATRKLARELGVDLAAVAGTGPGGRIGRADVERHAAGKAPESSAAAPARGPLDDPPAARSSHGDRVVPLRGVRRTIARTLTAAWQTVPHVTDYREVDATALLTTRAALKQRASERGDDELARALTPLALIVRIAATALTRHPYVNASVDLESEEITLRGRCNVGVATAAPEGLVVPVVRDADTLSVEEIAREISRLTAAARDNRLRHEDLGGGTFTVNNYGSLGIWLGTPIVKPPEVANLGIGAVRDQVVAVDGRPLVRPTVALAVAADHRILDGHTLAAFVSDLVGLIEQPALLLAELR